MSEPKDQSMSRRKALKVLSAAAGATTLSLLPGWEKPVVGIGALPAFAQASLGTGDFQATLTWNTATDIDLHVKEPAGFEVYYSAKVGPTATLDFDNIPGFGPENVFVAPGQFATGTYEVFVVYYSGSPSTSATIQIKVFANTPQQQIQTFTKNLESPNRTLGYNIANVTFPAGTIVATSGTRPALGIGAGPKS